MPAKETPNPTLTWFEALNEQYHWLAPEDFSGWFHSVVGGKQRSKPPTQSAINRFTNTLRQLRLNAAAVHFGTVIDTNWLNEQLQECRLVVDTSTDSARWPALRVRANSSEPDDVLEALRLTLILQFASFIADNLDNRDSSSRIERCLGLYRNDAPLPEAAVFPAELESKWRQEIALINDNAASADDILRCEDFFVKTPKARFCSDACRFSTFQIAKQLQEPDYLATKQKRYRERAKK